MPAYHYISLSQDHKELSGIIEAPDETAARKKLGELNLSVISLNEIQKTAQTENAPQTQGKTTFEFEALDKNSKKIVGTIVAEDIIKAYARLFEEYQLNIIYLAPSQLPADEKEKQRREGISQIQKQYQRMFGKAMKKEKSEEQDTDELAARSELLKKVDFTIQKIESFLQQYSAELKIEERDVIQAYINQLQRIKDSTNLEHIRSTCKRMLDHIQKQELFIHEEQKIKESSKLKVETKQMLSDLKQTGMHKDIDILKIVESLQNSPIIKPFAGFILRLFKPKNEEITKIKNEIKLVNQQIFEYIKIFFINIKKNPTIRHEAAESIKMLWAERKRLKLKLQALKEEENAKNESAIPESHFWEQIGAASGWILFFYLSIYAISYPFTIKNLEIIRLPKVFYFYSSGLPKIFTLLLFLIYAAITTRNFWLRKRWEAALVLYSGAAFAFLLILINLT